MKLELGDVIAGKYCVEKKIGEGGMATVFRCIHMDLDRPVAIKLLSHSQVTSEAAVERFLNEARVAASVRHRHVVDVLDFGTMTDGTPYMVMELLEGCSLAERLSSGEPIHVSAVIKLVAQVLSGLGAVHAAGIVHRDVKPENIFLVRDEDGEFAKLLDFGISRAGADSSPTLRSVIPTLAGHLVGTPQYMSPEQARGLKRVDHRTDVYSIGVVLYEALTGELPFDSEFYGDVLVMITTQATPILSNKRPDLGQPLSDVVERAMARDPAARHQSAREMREALLLAVDQVAAVSTRWVVANAVPIRRRNADGSTSIPAATIEQPAAGKSGAPDRMPTIEARPTLIEAVPASDSADLAPPRKTLRWVALALGAAVLAAAVAIGLVFLDPFASEAASAAEPPASVREPEQVQAQSVERARADAVASAPAPAAPAESGAESHERATPDDRAAPRRNRVEALPRERSETARTAAEETIAGQDTGRTRPRIRRVIDELDF